MNVGVLNLKAGTSEIVYKFLSGEIAGDFVAGTGEAFHATSDVANNASYSFAKLVTGTSTTDKQDALLRQSFKNMKTMPGGDPLKVFDDIGDGLSWVGNKIVDLAEWSMDHNISPIARMARDASKAYAKEGAELKAKHDAELRAKRLTPSPQMVQLGAHIDAYNKAAMDLATLINTKGVVNPKQMENAHQEYDAKYWALVGDPMYADAFSSKTDELKAISLLNRPAQESTYRPATTSAEIKTRDNAAKETNDYTARLNNPITPEFKANIEGFKQQIGNAVEMKRQEYTNGRAQKSYNDIAKSYNANNAQLASCLGAINQGQAAIAMLLKQADGALASGAAVDAASLNVAHQQIEQLKKMQEAQTKQLAEIEKANRELLAKHKHAAVDNAIYKESKESKGIGKALAATQKTIDEAQKVLPAPTLSALEESLCKLEEKNKANATAVVTVTPSVYPTVGSTNPTATNEEKLQILISQNPLLVNNPALLEKATAEAAKLIGYYKNGVAGEGNDTVFDTNEMAKAIQTLKDKGIVPAVPAAANLIAQNKPNNIERQ
jgi:hypothetical protein